MSEQIVIAKVIVQIGEQEIPLTVEAAKELRDRLTEMFPDTKKAKANETSDNLARLLDEVRRQRGERIPYPFPHPYPVPYPVYPRYPRPYWEPSIIYKTTSGATITLSAVKALN